MIRPFLYGRSYTFALLLLPGGCYALVPLAPAEVPTALSCGEESEAGGTIRACGARGTDPSAAVSGGGRRGEAATLRLGDAGGLRTVVSDAAALASVPLVPSRGASLRICSVREEISVYCTVRLLELFFINQDSHSHACGSSLSFALSVSVSPLSPTPPPFSLSRSLSYNPTASIFLPFPGELLHAQSAYAAKRAG